MVDESALPYIVSLSLLILQMLDKALGCAKEVYKELRDLGLTPAQVEQLPVMTIVFSMGAARFGKFPVNRCREALASVVGGMNRLRRHDWYNANQGFIPKDHVLPHDFLFIWGKSLLWAAEMLMAANLELHSSPVPTLV